MLANIIFANVNLIDGSESLHTIARVDDVARISHINDHGNVGRVRDVLNVEVDVDGLATEAGSIAAFLEESRLLEVVNLADREDEVDEVVDAVNGRVDGVPVNVDEAADAGHETLHDHQGLILALAGVAIAYGIVLGKGADKDDGTSYRLDEHFEIDYSYLEQLDGF